MLYTCKDAKEDTDLFFSKGERSLEKEEALNRALYGHMTVGSTLKKHNVACWECWEYYQKMKKEHCGG